MATLMDKQKIANIHSMLGIIAVQVADGRLKGAEENLNVLARVISEARKEMNGLEMDEDVITFDVDQF